MRSTEAMISKVNYAIVLAAGFGTRLKPLTDQIPKALVEIGGVPILKRTLDTLSHFNFKNIFINTHYHSEQIDEFLKVHCYKASTLYEPEILETGGTLKIFGINNPEIESVMVINCDALFSNFTTVIEELINSWDPVKMDGLFTLVPSLKNNTSADFEISDKNKLIYPVKNLQKAYTFASPYIIKPKLLQESPLQKFSIIRDFVYPNFSKFNNLYGYPTNENWIDIGTPKDLEVANSLFANKK